MSVVVVAAPMVTRWQPDRGRINPGSSDNTSNQRTTGTSSASIQRTTDVRPILSITPDFSNPSISKYPDSGTLVSVGQANIDRGNPLLITHDQIIPGSSRAQTQTRPPIRHSHTETLLTTSFPTHTTQPVPEVHGDSNEEDEGSSDYEDVESDDTEGQTGGGPGQSGEQKTERRKSKRFRLTHNQTRFLMGEFARQTHPDSAQRKRLSKEIPGLSPRQVQVWFQNRRAKLKRLTADDREKMMRSRALPENFDMSRTLRSPFDTNAPQGYPIQRQTPLSSPGFYNAPQPREATHSRSPSDAANLRRVSGDGSAMSPMGLSANFTPYLGHFTPAHIAAGDSLSAQTQRRSLTYDPYQQDRSRTDELGARSASFSSGMPEHNSRGQPGLDNPQASTQDKPDSSLRARRSYGTSVDMNVHDETSITPIANLTNTFSPQDQRTNTFQNLMPETLTYLNTQSPLQPSDSTESRYNFRSNLDPSSSFMPSLHTFPHLSPLQVDTQLQGNEAASLLNQQSGLEYGGNLQNIGATHPRYDQSPATAYQTPISGTTQEFSIPNTADFFPISYQSEANKDIDSYAMNMAKASDITGSNVIPQEYYKSEHNTPGESLEMPMQGSVYNPRYQLSQIRAGNVVPLAISQIERFTQQQHLAGMPPTPQSAGLKRRLDDESEEGSAQAAAGRKKRKSVPGPSGYISPNTGKRPSI